MHRGWAAVFRLLALAMGASNVLFFTVTPLYQHRMPEASSLTRVAQVLVDVFRKRHAGEEDGPEPCVVSEGPKARAATGEPEEESSSRRRSEEEEKWQVEVGGLPKKTTSPLDLVWVEHRSTYA
jgi:hypothetical protein